VNDLLKSYLDETVPLIDEEMFSFLQESEPLKFLYGPMRDYPLRGGKRFRSALVLLSCEALGGDRDRALHTAVAFELFQSFALVHDDIEDGSEMRRGKPCLHHLHGIPLSINVGDALYSKVFEALAANRSTLGEGPTLQLMDEMIHGAQKTFEGQAYDIGWVASGEMPSVEAFVEMLRLKTGWYSGRGPCSAGAIVAGAPDSLRQAVGDFGETIAVAFQIRDDLLNLSTRGGDATQAPGATAGGYGKERGGDIAEGKRTLMVIDCYHRCAAEDREQFLEILEKHRSDTTGTDIEWVIDLMVRTGSVERAEKECADRAHSAVTHLEALPPSEMHGTMEAMSHFLVERVF
jgi:geranylgeranyl diphosphate synthase type II